MTLTTDDARAFRRAGVVAYQKGWLVVAEALFLLSVGRRSSDYDRYTVAYRNEERWGSG